MKNFWLERKHKRAMYLKRLQEAANIMNRIHDLKLEILKSRPLIMGVVLPVENHD